MAKESTKVVSTPVTDVKSAKKGDKRGANEAIEKVVSAKKQKLKNDEALEALHSSNGTPNGREKNKGGGADSLIAFLMGSDKSVGQDEGLPLNCPVNLEPAPERGAGTPNIRVNNKGGKGPSLAAFLMGSDNSLGHKEVKIPTSLATYSNNLSSVSSKWGMKKVDTSSPPASQDPGPKTLFVGNLSFKAKENDVREFFKTVAEVVRVKLGIGVNGELKGFCHVEFATPEGAEKALDSLNGRFLLNRPVKLALACGGKRGNKE